MVRVQGWSRTLPLRTYTHTHTHTHPTRLACHAPRWEDQDFKLPSHAEVHANAKPMFSSKWERLLPCIYLHMKHRFESMNKVVSPRPLLSNIALNSSLQDLVR